MRQIFSIIFIFVILFKSNVEGGLSSDPLKFVILICSYNNAKYVEENILSAVNQDYPYFRIIYVDDGSTDGTVEVLCKILEQYKKQHLVKIIRNKENKGAPLPNHYDVIHNEVDDNEVIVLLDGDDYLAHNRVLRHLGQVYRSKWNIWLTYGQFHTVHSREVGWCCRYPKEVIANNAFREFVHMPSHLKTFYAWLFKKIRKEDLLYEGKFYNMAGDLAIMLPMIEMAKNHHRFIPDVLYLYNDGNEISEHQRNFKEQMDLAKHIRSLPKYEPLD